MDQAATADAVVAGVERRRTAMTRRYEAGDVDRLAATSATAEYLDGALGRLRAHLQAQQALADLENAVQAPLLLPNPVAPIDAPVQNSTKARSP